MSLFNLIQIVFGLSIVPFSNPDHVEDLESTKPIANYIKTMNKADEALTFCLENDFNTDYCILIDMSIHSGVKRFFVWDFNTNSIQYNFLVSHGCGDNTWSDDLTKTNPRFSNVKSSYCSSLGKYKIGNRGYSNWGINIKYLMHGLESTNSNALSRYIVFHSWEDVSDTEPYPEGTPEGWGCPAVSDKSMKTIDPILRSSSKPVLMWIYED